MKIRPPKVTAAGWTPTVTAYVRARAAQGANAPLVAAEIGLSPDRLHGLYRFARLQGIKFSKGRPKFTKLALRVDSTTARAIAFTAQARGISRETLAARILACVIEQGETFVTNILDEEG